MTGEPAPAAILDANSPARLDRLDPAVDRIGQRHLKGQLDLERHGGRTFEGICARIAQRLLAMAAASWHNWLTSADDKRSLIAYDHCCATKESLIAGARTVIAFRRPAAREDGNPAAPGQVEAP